MLDGMSTWSSGVVGGHPSGSLAVRLFLESSHGRTVAAVEAGRRARAVRRPLRWVAVSYTLTAAATVAVLWPGIAAGAAGPQLVAAVAIALAAAFWAVWGWAAVAPLPAALVGLTAYVSLLAAGWSTLPAATWPGSTAQAVGQMAVTVAAVAYATTTVGLFARSIAAAVAVRRAADPFVPSTGVFPALSLYVLLLAVVCGARAAVASAGVDPLDATLLAMRAMAVVVAVAAIVGWRSVWPAVADAGRPSWLLAGVLAGLGTFAWATLYAAATSALFGLAPTPNADPLVDAGYGWAGAVAAVVLYPSIVEELAFRGLILPRLARTLSGGEAVVVSAAMFAVLHLNPSAIPVLLPVGLALGVLRRRSGSLWPCVLMHLTHNAAVMAGERWL